MQGDPGENQELRNALKRYGLDGSIYGTPKRTYLRITGSAGKDEVEKAIGTGLTLVPWCRDYFFTQGHAKVPEWLVNRGLVAVQDAVSGIPVAALDPRPGQSVLDMAAAPGLKTAYISHLMRGKGEIWAVDNDPERKARLDRTIKTYNISNARTFLADSRYFLMGKKEKFDRVLVDAPCTTEGSVANIRKVVGIWSWDRVEKFSRIQKAIIKNGFHLLKRGGILVYCTCSFMKEENEDVVESLLRVNRNARISPVWIKRLKTRRGFLRDTVRIYPQDNGTNGMFIAKVEKR